MLSYALVSRQGKSLKKSSFTEQKERKFITADTAHLLNRIGVLVTACFSTEQRVCLCVCMYKMCMCVLSKSRNGQRHSFASLSLRHLNQNTSSMQTSCLSVTAWSHPLRFPADCWSHWTPH